MSFRRLFLVFKTDLAMHAKRPLTWVLVVVMALTVWGLSTGNVRIDSGDASVGGTKAWITSEFAIAYTLSVTVFLFYVFFLAIAAGMAVIQDDERKIGELLHATPLTPHEYVGASFPPSSSRSPGSSSSSSSGRCSPTTSSRTPRPTRSEVRSSSAYLVPAVMFGSADDRLHRDDLFAVGLRWRKPILVFVLPVTMIRCARSSSGTGPHVARAVLEQDLMALDLPGSGGSNETHPA
jgi:low affinity Fe/Cu permease